jgi:hypothetical protein
VHCAHSQHAPDALSANPSTMNMAMLMCETLVLVLKKEAKPKYCGGRFVEYKWSDPVSDAHKPARDWGRTIFFRVEVAKLVCSNILWFGILCCSFLVPGVTPLPECFMGIVAFWESIAVFLLVMCSSGQRRGIQHPAGNAVQLNDELLSTVLPCALCFVITTT